VMAVLPNDPATALGIAPLTPPLLLPEAL